MYTGDKKLLLTTEPKTFHFDLPIDVRKNLKHEINFIIKHNECLAEHTIKNNIIVQIQAWKRYS